MNLEQKSIKCIELPILTKAASPQIQQSFSYIFQVFHIPIINFLDFNFVDDFLIKFNEDIDKHVIVACLFGSKGKVFKLLENFFVNVSKRNF